MTDGVIVLDKPAGMTSFQAVRRTGIALRQRKCGHAGTLDPMATGVLPVCVGRATKIAGYLTLQEKEYEVSFRVGLSTDTGDVTGRPVESRPERLTTEDGVRAAAAALVGTFDQVPPAHSAVKVQGVRSYVLARQGKSVALPPRRVTVFAARLLSFQSERFALALRCSKGFYVRALPDVLGRRLGVPMTVEALRRTRSGPFPIEESVSLDALSEAAARGEAQRYLVPIGKALAGLPVREIPDEAAVAVRQGRSPGRWLAGEDLPEGTAVLLTHAAAGPVALVARDAAGLWTILRGL